LKQRLLINESSGGASCINSKHVFTNEYPTSNNKLPDFKKNTQIFHLDIGVLLFEIRWINRLFERHRICQILDVSNQAIIPKL